jgi:hypothetical protein
MDIPEEMKDVLSFYYAHKDEIFQFNVAVRYPPSFRFSSI